MIEGQCLWCQRGDLEYPHAGMRSGRVSVIDNDRSFRDSEYLIRGISLLPRSQEKEKT